MEAVEADCQIWGYSWPRSDESDWPVANDFGRIVQNVDFTNVRVMDEQIRIDLFPDERVVAFH